MTLFVDMFQVEVPKINTYKDIDYVDRSQPDDMTCDPGNYTRRFSFYTQ